MYNRVVLMGRITADPELRQTQSGVPVLSFSVACDRPSGKSVERQTDFIPCVAWRNTADFISRYFKKGKPIVLEGKIQVTGYTDKAGEKRKRIEVVADSVSFAPTDTNGQKAKVDVNPSDDFQEVDGLDDLPF